LISLMPPTSPIEPTASVPRAQGVHRLAHARDAGLQIGQAHLGRLALFLLAGRRRRRQRPGRRRGLGFADGLRPGIAARVAMRQPPLPESYGPADLPVNSIRLTPGDGLVPSGVGDVLGEPGDEVDGIGAEHIGVAPGVLSGGLVVNGV